MIVIFVKKNAYGENENVIFLGCYDDMKSCKQAIIKNANEYVNKNELQINEIEDDESYYVVFDTNTKEEKEKFFVRDCKLKVTVEVEDIEGFE